MQHFNVAYGRYILSCKRQKSYTENTYGLLFEREKIKNGGGRDTASNRIRMAQFSVKHSRFIFENIEQMFHAFSQNGFAWPNVFLNRLSI